MLLEESQVRRRTRSSKDLRQLNLQVSSQSELLDDEYRAHSPDSCFGKLSYSVLNGVSTRLNAVK